MFVRTALFIVFMLIPGLQAEAANDAGDPLRIFTHGQGDFARFDGVGFDGTGMDLLRCSLGRIGRSYSVSQAAMARKSRLAQQGAMDIWFPSLDFGPEEKRARIVAPIGSMPLYWYVLKGSEIDTAAASFKAEAKVSAFPGSSPARLLLAEGYNAVPGTDDENAAVLWLIEGRIDAFLGANFDALLKPGAKALFDAKIERNLFREFNVGFEVSVEYARRDPKFVPAFQAALLACQ